ncbi:MAG: tail fiber protein [Trichlorobacter sp.]|uniref:phage tail protein n=1 Tax=Trichlorobacter sp. TaxID=2911007 RepID=UPI002561D5F4|nr:tail fiber protein [Trichlorobacter sp.]MDK9717827.1 tail fiber protein [Trichlorobacter sp.]
MTWYRLKKTMILPLLALLVLLCTVPAQADDPFLGEIRWVAFNFVPRYWARCDGQILPIQQNQALFSLLGTTFGGDGRINFALPDMRSRAPIHVGSTYTLGSKGGEESHGLTSQEMPIHTHSLKADPREGSAIDPTNNYPAKNSGGGSAYGSSATASMASGAVASTGNSQPHENMKPYSTLNCIIALSGIYPSQN